MAIGLTCTAVVARRPQRNAHSAHIPTHAALVDANRRIYTTAHVPQSDASATQMVRVADSDGLICRLFATGSCNRGGDCKRAHDRRPRNPSPGLRNRMDAERGARRRVAARWSQPHVTSTERSRSQLATYRISLGRAALTTTPIDKTRRTMDSGVHSTHRVTVYRFLATCAPCSPRTPR